MTNTITDAEFGQFQRFIYEAAGITLSSAKKALVSGRLAKRLKECQVGNYGEYFALLRSGQAQDEVQTAVDLLTTNETYFFRETKHFELLRQAATAAPQRGHPFRVWSAASSTGEEAYSMAMVLADCLGIGEGAAPWEVMGSDISSRVLERARVGHYPLERTQHIPPAYLKRFCLKGMGPQAGTLLVERSLRSRVSFTQINLNTALPRLAAFDVIFLRNVMIYFNAPTKRQVIARVLETLKPGGHFFIGHSESLNELNDTVTAVAPSVYRKP
jgi:chemotaxis protein methyltransferase CheR